jgi:hypothetical protein
MIYFKTCVGIELRGEDMLIASLQSHFSGGTFTHFKRIANFRLSDTETLRREIQSFFKSNGLSKDNIVLGIPRKDIVMRYLDLPSEVGDNLKQVVRYQVQSFEPTEEDRFYYDYAVLKNSSAQKRLEILLVMVKKSLLDDHLFKTGKTSMTKRIFYPIYIHHLWRSSLCIMALLCTHTKHPGEKVKAGGILF